MAVEVNLNIIGSGYNRALINENFVEIEEALEDALSRTGSSPNSMGVDLDMDSNDLLNVGILETERLIVGNVEFAVDEALAVGPAGESATITIGTVTTGAAGTDVIVTNVGDQVNAVFDITIPRGNTGASGAGSGDMVAAQNLSDVANAATSFANIKQAATTSATGVVELATVAEAEEGTDTTRAVTPEGVKAAIDASIPTIVQIVELASGALSSVSTLSLNISSYISTYRQFKLLLLDIKPTTDAVDFRLRTSADGSSYDTGSSDYQFNYKYTPIYTDSGGTNSSSGVSYIKLIETVGNESGEGISSCEIIITNPASTSSRKEIRSIGSFMNSTGFARKAETIGMRVNTSSIRGIRVYFDSGNISSGSYVLYGIK